MNKIFRVFCSNREAHIKGLLTACVYFAVVTLFVSSQAYAQRELLEAKWSGQQLNIVLTDTKLRITPINGGTVEVFYEPSGTQQLPSFALPKNHDVFAEAEFTKTSSGYLLSLPNLQVNIQSLPFALSFSNKQGQLIKEEIGLFNYDTTRGFRFELSEKEKIMGGGQRVLGMDRRGHRMPLYNKAHYGYTTESNQMYFSLPAIMSSKGYAIAFDNSANGFLDIGHTQQNILQFEADAGRTSYIFSAGDDFYQLVENFVSATGKQPLPPRWALGNYASRFGYKTQQQVLDTIDKFIEQDFPVDAVVLDLYWFGPDIKGHMGNLNWDLDNWPEPEKMIQTLHEKGVNTIMITEPFILSTSSQWDSAVKNQALAKDFAGEVKTFDFYFGNTGLVDVFDPKAQAWFWQYYQALNEQGIAGWWGDLGEPEVHPGDSIHKLAPEYGNRKVTGNEIHNAYGHQWANLVYNKQKQARPDERPFIMMRAGFVGSQRYAMVPWTGDVARSWGGLQPQVELALQMSMFGLAYTHSDLGGFAGGDTFDAELYTRWLQYGAFQPVYRPHAQDNIAPEPVFHDETTQDIVRKYVKLRYRLLPYNYSLSMRNSMSGIPMMRPLFMDFPKQSISRTDAYLWGDAFLVAPIVEQGQLQKEILFPKGVWFDYWQNTKLNGQQKHVVEAPLDTLPVFVKAGSFVPTVADIPNTQNYSSASLRVDYYADLSVPQSLYTLYEDDGKDPNSLAQQNYQTLVFQSAHKEVLESETLTINVTVNGQYENAPVKRKLTSVIHGLKYQPSEVFVDNVKVEIRDNKEMLNNTDSAYYDTNTHQLWVSGRLVKQLIIKIK
jgi:oligosaccharide 4-alpha-D-glucosyltransferase